MKERKDVNDVIEFLNNTKIRSLYDLKKYVIQVETAIKEVGKIDDTSLKTYNKAMDDLREISKDSDNLSKDQNLRINNIKRELAFIEGDVKKQASVEAAQAAQKEAPIEPKADSSKIMSSHRRGNKPKAAAQKPKASTGQWTSYSKGKPLSPMAKGLLQQSRSAKHEGLKSEEQKAMEASTANIRALKALEEAAELTFEIRIENPEQNDQIRAEAIEFAEAHGSVKEDANSVEADFDGTTVKVEFDDKGATVSVKSDSKQEADNPEAAQDKAYNAATEMVKAITNPDNTVSTTQDNTKNQDVQARIEAEQASPSYEI